MDGTEKETRFSSDQRERKSDFCWSGFSHSDLKIFPHHVLSEHNLHNKDVEHLPFVEQFPFNCNFHVPYLPPNTIDRSLLSLRNGDPAASLVHEKQEWSNRIDSIVKKYRMKYNRSFESIKQVISYNCQSAIIPNHIAVFMELTEQDPDSHFSGVTNWYYAGGRLSYVSVDNQMVLLTSGGRKNELLFTIPLTENKETGWQLELAASTKERTTSNEAILQILGLSTNGSGLIGVRQRNLCTIYMLEPEEGSFILRGTHSANSNQKPFTSLNFSAHNLGLYCTSSVNRQVSLWDARSCSCIASDIVERPAYNLSNSWCSVQFQESPNSIVMADSVNLSWLDARIGLSKPTTTFCIKNQSPLVLPCEDITLLVPSAESSPKLYVATSHHVLEYDPRATCAVERWTHLLRSPPIYAQAVRMRDHREMICIANQEPAEVVLIVNGCTKLDSICASTVLPYALPTLRETLHNRHMHGQLLDPQTQRRLKVSATGVLCLPREDSYQILTQTALGDVFIQDLEKSEAASKHKSYYDEKINNWNDECLKQNCRKRAKITGVKNYRTVFNNLRNPAFKMRPYDRGFSLQESLQISKSQLFCYKDILAAELLTAWNVESLPEWGDAATQHECQSAPLDPTLVSLSPEEDQQQWTDPMMFVNVAHSDDEQVTETPSQSQLVATPVLNVSDSVCSHVELDVMDKATSVGEELPSPSIRPTVKKVNLSKSNELTAKKRSNVSGF